MARHALITGTSSGLGRALAKELAQRGWRLFGCSRRGCDLPDIHDLRLDLTDYDALYNAARRRARRVLKVVAAFT